MQDPEKTPKEEETENEEDGTGEQLPESIATDGSIAVANPEEAKVDTIKIVINIKGNRATIGVQAPNCDPVFGMVEGNRDEIAQGALRILGEAEEKWKTTPRYPRSTTPAPAPTQAPVRTTSSTTKTAPASSKAGAPLF